MTKYKLYKLKIKHNKRYKTLNFKIDNTRYYYVYRITHKQSGTHYYGSRVTKKSPKLDILKYGSSSKLKKHILENKHEYKFKIIKTFNNMAEMMIYESFLHNYFNVKDNDKFWNNANQTPYGFSTLNKANYIINGKIVNIDNKKAKSLNLIPYNKGINHVYYGKKRITHSVRMIGQNNSAANFKDFTLYNYKTGESIIIDKDEYYNKHLLFTPGQIKYMETGHINKNGWSKYNKQEIEQILLNRKNKMSKILQNKMVALKNIKDFIIKYNNIYMCPIDKLSDIQQLNINTIDHILKQFKFRFIFIKQVLQNKRRHHKKYIFAYTLEELNKKFTEYHTPKSCIKKAFPGKLNPNAKKYKISNGIQTFYTHGNLKIILKQNNINPYFKKCGNIFINADGYTKEQI